MTFTFTEQIRPLRYALIDYVSVLKEASPCHDCENKFPACCMDFDHRPQETKVACVGTLVLTRTLEEVEAEIAKCDLVCANCHRIRTQARSAHRRAAIGRELKLGLKTQRAIAKEFGTSEGLVSALRSAAAGITPKKQLSKEQREEIRRLKQMGKTQRELATMFGCSQSHISLVARGLR